MGRNGRYGSFLTKSSASHTKKTSSTKTASKQKPASSAAARAKRATDAEPRRSAWRAQRESRQAFVASTELRPMAQQLMTMRTPAAYAGVSAYAHRQTGDAAGAAYLALGRAYLLDKRYADASANLRLVRQHSEVLADYADFLAAEAEHRPGQRSRGRGAAEGIQ